MESNNVYKFKMNDVVKNNFGKIGMVFEIDYNNDDYPIKVIWDDGDVKTYTMSGLYNKDYSSTVWDIVPVKSQLNKINNIHTIESNSNVYKLRPRLSKHNQMHIFYDSLESRGVPNVLFNGYINGLNLEINNKQTKLVIADGLTLATEIEWQVFIEFKAHDEGVTKMKPLFGAHSDFED